MRRKIDQLLAEPPVADLGYPADQRLVATVMLGLKLLADSIDNIEARLAQGGAQPAVPPQQVVPPLTVRPPVAIETGAPALMLPPEREDVAPLGTGVTRRADAPVVEVAEIAHVAEVSDVAQSSDVNEVTDAAEVSAVTEAADVSEIADLRGSTDTPVSDLGNETNVAGPDDADDADDADEADVVWDGWNTVDGADAEIADAEIADAEMADAEMADAEMADAEMADAEVADAEVADAADVTRVPGSTEVAMTGGFVGVTEVGDEVNVEASSDAEAGSDAIGMQNLTAEIHNITRQVGKLADVLKKDVTDVTDVTDVSGVPTHGDWVEPADVDGGIGAGDVELPYVVEDVVVMQNLTAEIQDITEQVGKLAHIIKKAASKSR